MAIEKNWKYYLGIALFVYSFLPYFVAVALFFLHMPITKLLAFLGVFIVSAEVSFIVSAALLGKTVIEYIKARLKGVFKSPMQAQSVRVGKARHYLGIVLLILSFSPYFFVEISLLLGYPKTDGGHTALFWVMLSGDAIFIISLFVLGSDFWERLKKLFEWQNA